MKGNISNSDGNALNVYEMLGRSTWTKHPKIGGITPMIWSVPLQSAVFQLTRFAIGKKLSPRGSRGTDVSLSLASIRWSVKLKSVLFPKI